MHYEGVGGPLLNTLPIPKLEYADVAITNKTIEEAPMRLSALSAGAPDAFLDMSMKKAKYRPTIKYYVTEITEAEVIALNLKFKCQACGRSFPTEKGLKIMTAQYARGGAVVDHAVQHVKRKGQEAQQPPVCINGHQIDNILHFEHFGCRLCGDVDESADVRYRMVIAQNRFNSLSTIWKDH